MRTLASRLWLLPGLVAGVSGTASLTFVDASFLGYSVSYGGVDVQTSIFDTTSVSKETSKYFTWTNNTLVTVRKVYLGNDETRQIISEGTPSDYGTQSSEERRNTVVGNSGIQLNISYSATGGAVSIDQDGLKTLVNDFRSTPLVFQVQWAAEGDSSTDNPADEYSYSRVWGFAEGQAEASVMYGTYPALGNDVAPIAQGTTAFLSAATQTPTAGSSTTAAVVSTSTASTTSSSNASSSKSSTSNKFGPLSTGALIGIIIGGVAFLMLALLIATLCLRRQRRRDPRNHEGHDRDAQDLMAEKEARAAGTAPDTPYSVDSSQPLHRGGGLSSGLHDNAVSMPRGVAADQGSSQRSSAVYSSLRNVASVGTGLGVGGGVGGGGGGGGGDSVMGGDSPTVTHPSSSAVSLHEPYADLVQEQFNRTNSSQHTTTAAAAAAAAAAAEPVSPNHDDDDDDDDNGPETEQSPLSPGSIREEPRPRASGSRTGTPQLGPTRLVRSDTPGGKSISDYLHEDGMTEDEIRRLEEEERALDEAIEQARTDSRAGRGR